VLGEPDERQRELLATYLELVDAVRPAMCPGATVAQLDELAADVRERHGLAEYGVYGIGHGIGLRFEEPPASTIIPAHRNLPLQEGMTVTIGHPVLAIPGFGGVRFEDVYRVTPAAARSCGPTRSSRSWSAELRFQGASRQGRNARATRYFAGRLRLLKTPRLSRIASGNLALL
jgi:Xaa-Pro aminopeptidase